MWKKWSSPLVVTRPQPLPRINWCAGLWNARAKIIACLRSLPSQWLAAQTNPHTKPLQLFPRRRKRFCNSQFRWLEHINGLSEPMWRNKLFSTADFLWRKFFRPSAPRKKQWMELDEPRRQRALFPTTPHSNPRRSNLNHPRQSHPPRDLLGNLSGKLLDTQAPPRSNRFKCKCDQVHSPRSFPVCGLSHFAIPTTRRLNSPPTTRGACMSSRQLSKRHPFAKPPHGRCATRH